MEEIVPSKDFNFLNIYMKFNTCTVFKVCTIIALTYAYWYVLLNGSFCQLSIIQWMIYNCTGDIPCSGVSRIWLQGGPTSPTCSKGTVSFKL